jgi:rod shape-determining protein MreD
MYTERDRLRMSAIKLSLYFLLILFAFTLQFLLPPLFIWSVRPLMLIVAAVVIAMFAGPHTGGFAGFICGMICDWISVYTVTYYTVALMLVCIALGIIADYSMRKTLLSAYFLSIIVLVITQMLFVAVFLLLYRRASVWAFVYVTTPEILYSLMLLPLIYFPARTIYRRTLMKRL